MSTFLNDIRYGLRMLRKNSGFTTVAVLTLALGIGANTAIFSVVNGVLLRALPFDHPEELVQLWEDPTGKGRSQNTVSGPAFADWAEQNTVLESLSAFTSVALNLTGEGGPERLRGLRVSASYLKVFRVQPVLGRGFLPDEDQPGKDKVVLLTHGLWQRRFGGDTNLVGRTIQLGGESRTVIGILPPEPVLARERELFVPIVLGSEARARNRGDHWLRVVARVKPGVTLEQVHAEMNAIMQRQKQIDLSEADAGVTVVPMREQITGEIRPRLLILLGAVGLVLLIACANVAGLLLAKAAARHKEMAIRTALGAGRLRVIRQLLTESLLLSLFGGAVGLLLAFWSTAALTQWTAAGLPRVEEIGLDAQVLGFALLASIVTGLTFGLTPALQLAAPRLNDALKAGGRTGRADSGSGIRQGLIVAEMGVTLMLLAGSGLMLKSLLRLQAVPSGFNPENVLAMSISLDNAKYPDGEHRAVFCSQIIQRVEALPGVASAGMAGNLPMSGWNNTSISVEGRTSQPESGYSTDYDYIGGSFFRTLSIPVLKGRAFTEYDNSLRAPRVAILSESLARKAFPDENPIGQRIRAFGQPWEVIGMVGDVRYHGLDSAAGERIYLPQAFCQWSGSLVVRTKVPPLTFVKAVRNEILALDPDQPVSNIRALEQIVADYLAQRRLMLVLVSLFAGAAILLTATGLYGIVVYSVSQRTREIGIRIALGATSVDVLRSVVGQGLKLTLIGTGVGMAGAFALTRVITSLLYDVSPTDPLTFVCVSLLMAGVALLACYIPARRAAKIDPMVALRCE